MTMTRPDVDLTDGTFYAGDSRAVLPLDAGERTGIPGPQRFGCRVDVPGRHRGRAKSRTVLQRRWRPARPRSDRDDDRDGRSATSVAAQARQLRFHPQARQRPGTQDCFIV